MATSEQTKGQKHIILQLGARKMNLSPDQFRQCAFIIDELVSTYDCHQFMTPVPSSAVVYHSKIKHPMDLKTLEENLFKNKYKNVKDFAKDLFLIWENAMRFHLSVDPIFQQASTLKKRYDEIILFIQGGKRPLYLSTEIEDASTIDKTLLPEELYNGKASNSEKTKVSGKSTLYGIHIFSAEDHSSKRMYGGTNQHVFQLLNSYFFEYMSTDEHIRKKMPLPRLYIAKNRTLLKQAHTDPNGALAIIYNVKLIPIDIKGETFSKIRASVLLAEPVKEVHDVDDSTMDFSESVTYSPKAWIKVKPLQPAVHNVESIINRDIDRNCLKKVFTTFRLSTEYNTDPKKIRNFEVAKYFSHCMLNPISTNSSEISSEIDSKLLEILTSTCSEAATSKSRSKSKSTSTPIQQQTQANQSSSSLATRPSKSTATRTKGIPPAPKLRSKVVSNADLEPYTVNYPKSSSNSEPLSYKKLKLTLSKGVSSKSSPTVRSLDPEENAGLSSPNVCIKSTVTSPKEKPSPIVIPVKDHKSTSTAAANLITKLNLKPPKEKSTKDKTTKYIPYNISSSSLSQSSSNKKLTINPPKDLAQRDVLNQFDSKRHKSSKASPTLSSVKAYTKPRKAKASLANEIESTSMAKEQSSSSEQVKPKDDSSLTMKASPTIVSNPPSSAIGHPSHYVPPLPPHHQLPENMIYGYPAYHTYVYGNPSGLVYPLPYGYPHPNSHTHDYQMYTSQNSLPPPQLLQVGYPTQPNASLDNASDNESYTQGMPLPSSSHPNTMTLPPLQLQIPAEKQNLPTQPEPNASQAEEKLPFLPASAPKLTVHRPVTLFRHFKGHKSLQKDHRKLSVILETPAVKQEPLNVSDNISVSSDSTASYEYSDPEDEDADQEYHNLISKYREGDESTIDSPVSIKSDAIRSTRSTQSFESTKSIELAQPTQPIRPVDDIYSDQSSQFVDTVHSIQPAETFISNRSAKTIEFTANVQPIKAHETNPSKSFTRYVDQFENEKPSERFIRAATILWTKIATFAKQKHVPIVDIHQYDLDMTLVTHGDIKSIFHIPNDSTKVIQTFKRMTITQRVSEVVGLLKLAKLPHMPTIYELLHDGKGEIVGICMQRFDKTLKEFTQTHTTVYQKMDIIIQMLEITLILHEIGLAHCDLSDANFMVNETNVILRDGSKKVELWLINLRKAIFIDSSDYKDWWVKCPDNINKDYDAEVVPRNMHDLDLWCKNLPKVYSKPVHNNYIYHSIETLPKCHSDDQMLSKLINPVAEDVYTLGMIIWKIVSGKEPWAAPEKISLNALREIIKDDIVLKNALEDEFPGSTSRHLLSKLLRVAVDKRCAAKEVLTWISVPYLENALIVEWEEYHKMSARKRPLTKSAADIYDSIAKKQKKS